MDLVLPLVRLVPPVLSVLLALCPLFPLVALLARFLPVVLKDLVAQWALQLDPFHLVIQADPGVRVLLGIQLSPLMQRVITNFWLDWG